MRVVPGVSGQVVMCLISCFIEEARRERNTVVVHCNLVELEVRTCDSSVTDGWAVRTCTLVPFSLQRLHPTGTQQTTSDRTQYWRYVESCLSPHHAHLHLVDPVPGPLPYESGG